MIYVVKHKDDIYIPLMKNYKIINVGELYEDNQRDNINHLNPYINETTALYDLWKNCDDEIIGLIHYRRLFVTVEGRALNFALAKEYINQLNLDLICTYYHMLDSHSIYDYFKYTLEVNSPHTVPTFEKYINRLNEIDPNIVHYFKTKDRFIGRNMFVGKKEIIDDYCEWLFSFIIDLTEEFIANDLQNVKGQERMIGHLVERIFSYWLEEKYGKLNKIGLMPYITFDDEAD